MEANYGKSWSEEDDRYLFSIFKDFPLTKKGYLSTEYEEIWVRIRILVSNMAFRFRRTESEIKERVRHLRNPQHPAYERLFYSSSIKMVYTIDINDVYTKARMEGNYWKRWSEEDDRYLISVFKDYPLTKKGYLSTENETGILVSNMAFRFRRTENAIKRRVIKLKNEQHTCLTKSFYSYSNTNDSLLTLEKKLESVLERGVLIDRILDILDVKMKLICGIVQK